MTMPQPICACCRDAIGAVWSATVPSGFVICGKGACEQWARARGEGIYGERTPPPVHRRRAAQTCAECGKRLPTARDQFRSGLVRYCSLTCRQRAGEGFTPAGAPTHPVDVQQHDGPGWRWVCAGCERVATGTPRLRTGTAGTARGASEKAPPNPGARGSTGQLSAG